MYIILPGFVGIVFSPLLLPPGLQFVYTSFQPAAMFLSKQSSTSALMNFVFHADESLLFQDHVVFKTLL